MHFFLRSFQFRIFLAEFSVDFLCNSDVCYAQSYTQRISFFDFLILSAFSKGWKKNFFRGFEKVEEKERPVDTPPQFARKVCVHFFGNLVLL